jgi:hypothetical protein
MTGNLLLDSIISLGAIALMVAVARLLFPPPPVALTEAEARERLAFDEPDFRPVRWLIDKDGRAALAEGAEGDVALVSRLGLDLVTRRYPAAAVRAAEEDGALVVRPNDPGSRRVVIAADGAADWARKFSAAHDIR